VEWLDKALVEITFFYFWGCTEETLLTSEVGVVEEATGNVANGLATAALGLLMSEHCENISQCWV